MVDARKKEIETEQHLKKIAEREEGRLQQEVLRLQKEIDELKERKNVYEVKALSNSLAHFFNGLGVQDKSPPPPKKQKRNIS